MRAKTYFTAIAASLLIAPLGVVYSADYGTDQNSKSPAAQPPANQAPAPANTSSGNVTWTKEEAMKFGVTEQQFNDADKNHDGKLNSSEWQGSGLEDKLPTSR